MSQYTFSGGIHPFDGKGLSKDKPVKEVLPKGLLVFPLSQHIGAPAKAVVAVGDSVKAGQLIAEANGFVSANIFSSVSGTVKAIEPHRVPTGAMVNSIVIENDGKYEEVSYPAPKAYEEMTGEEIVNAVRAAGVVGMGGAGFPTAVKLSPKNPEKIDYIIANCVECEPYLTSDYRRMMENPELVIDGLKCVLKVFPRARGIIAIEDNKPDAVEKMKSLTANESSIEVYSLKTKYPQGGERQLIYACTKRAINSKMLPADAGCIVDNCETLVAINRAVKENKPTFQRIVTITGDAINDPRNFLVRMGSSFNELISEAGGLKSEPEQIVSGGPMMGFSVLETDVPVTKTSSAMLFLLRDDALHAEETACINCGRCVEVCPSRLIPSQLATYGEHENYEKFNQLFGSECIECGSCSYVCPAKRQLAQAIKGMKRLAAAKAKEEAKGGDK